YEVVTTESVLAPPRVKPRIIQTAALAIHPDDIPSAVRALERPSLAADLLEVIANQPEIDAKDALKATGAGKSHLEKLIESDWITRENDQLALNLTPEDLALRLNELRKLDKPLRILKILAREGDPVDVSWIYAQADATLADLKRLEEEDLILLGEQQRWRDSLANKDFVPVSPPTLAPEQQIAWERLEAAIMETAHSQKREDQKTEQKESNEALQGLDLQRRANPSLAENRLWDTLKNMRFGDYQFRRQEIIERFIVDFYCRDIGLVIEVGASGQYTRNEETVRERYLNSLGLYILRFSDEEIADDLPDVLKRIERGVAEQAEYADDFEPLPVLTHARKGFGSVQEAEPDDEPEILPEKSPTFLLHGVTGSGKTELYLRAIDLTLALGRSAIFLVPEIALTPQTVRRVAARFPGKTAVVHSALGEGERYDTWRRARDGLVRIVVGARSALFTPLQDIGLIVLDEEHDHSYKHSPPTLPPYYHARDLAEEMMRRNNGIVILGSATPDIETTYRVEQGAVEKLELPRRIMGHRVRINEQAERAGVLPRYQADKSSADDAVMIDLPPVQVVDMRSELKDGNIS
ncbi:MAG: DUF559 domain-containing protein, partial [Chloroflexota bacterium]